MDLIDYNGEKCVNVMSFGLDTMVETMGRKIAGKAKFLGHQAYNIAVLPALMHLHYQINFEIDVADKDGDTFKWSLTPADYTLFAICNASYYGGGFCPAPNSLIDDGLLDFALLKMLIWLRLCRLFLNTAQAPPTRKPRNSYITAMPCRAGFGP